MLMVQSVKLLAPVLLCEQLSFMSHPDTFYHSHLPKTVSVCSARVNSLWKRNGQNKPASYKLKIVILYICILIEIHIVTNSLLKIVTVHSLIVSENENNCNK